MEGVDVHVDLTNTKKGEHPNPARFSIKGICLAFLRTPHKCAEECQKEREKSLIYPLHTQHF